MGKSLEPFKHPVNALAIHPVLEGFSLNRMAGGKDVAAAACTEALLSMGADVRVWPLPWGDTSPSELILSQQEIKWDGGWVTIAPTLRLPTSLDIVKTITRGLIERLAGRGSVSKLVYSAMTDRNAQLDQILRWKPDLVHLHQSGNTIITDIKQRASSLPVVLTNHTGTTHPCYEAFDMVVVPSKWMHSLMIKNAPHMENRLKVIHYFAKDIYIGDSSAQSRDGICFIGLLDTDRKGLHILLEALRILKNKGVSTPLLRVVGDGKLRQQYEKFSETHDLTVEFLGKLSDTDNARILQQSALFCMPSFVENFPLVYIEALTCGCPVIGFRPAVEELNNLFGYKIGSPFDAKTQSAEKLSTLIANWLHEMRWSDEVRSSIREHSATFFSKERYIQKYKNIYSSIIDAS